MSKPMDCFRAGRTLVFCVFLAAPGARAEDEAVLPSVLPEGLPHAVAELPQPAELAGASAHPCMGERMLDPRWFDRAQGFFSKRVCTPATWFDRFFGGERTDDVASALVRVLPSVQYSERDFTDAGVRVRARWNLPNLRDRLNVVVNDDSDERDGLMQGETQRPQQANAPGRESSAALRYLVRLAGRSGADIDVGLRGDVKLFTRARYYYLWEHSPVLQSRITQSLFFRDGEGFGESTRFEVERLLAEDLLLRWTTLGTLSEELDGFELREGVQLLRQIDRRRALSWSLSMTASPKPVWRASAYATGVRFRQRAFRPWFFFEIEPFIDAERADNFRPNPGIAFRLEFLVGDAGEETSVVNVAVPARTETGAAVMPQVPTEGAPSAEPFAPDQADGGAGEGIQSPFTSPSDAPTGAP